MPSRVEGSKDQTERGGGTKRMAGGSERQIKWAGAAQILPWQQVQRANGWASTGRSQGLPGGVWDARCNCPTTTGGWQGVSRWKPTGSDHKRVGRGPSSTPFLPRAGQGEEKRLGKGPEGAWRVGSQAGAASVPRFGRHAGHGSCGPWGPPGACKPLVSQSARRSCVLDRGRPVPEEKGGGGGVVVVVPAVAQAAAATGVGGL